MATMSRTPDNATITVSPAKLARAPRSKRPPAPTAKVRKIQALRRTRRVNRAESPLPLQSQDVEDSDDDYEEENENTATTLEELLVLVKDLKRTIDQQNKSIQEAQTELKELEEQQHVKEQNNELKDEICLKPHDDANSWLRSILPHASSHGYRVFGSSLRYGSTKILLHM
jgi:DNA repair exonuclease SbcCD ATPase subunit